MSQKNKILCIGLDGGTWSVLDRMLEKGYMPNLKNIIEIGRHGILKSTFPPITPAAWSTFRTGCNPGKHGVFDFQMFDLQSHTSSIVDSHSICVPTLEQLLTRFDNSSIVIDLPVTYPPIPINGTLISGLLTPNRDVDFTYPPELKLEIEKYLGRHWTLFKEDKERFNPHQDIDGFLSFILDMLDSRVKIACYLMDKQDADFVFVQIQCLDYLQHPYWKYLDITHSHYDEALNKMLCDKFFKPLDQAIGTLVECAQKNLGPDVLYLLVSDHGFQSNQKNVALNQWLMENGYLVSVKQPWYSWKNWYDLVRRLDRFNLRKKIVNKKKADNLTKSLYSDIINFAKSEAFAFSSFWGYIYLNNKENSIIEKITEQLMEWNDPGNGNQIVKNVYRREDIYNGEQLDKLPHLIIEPDDGYTFTSRVYFKSEDLIRKIDPDKRMHVGTHHIDGVFVVSGNGINPSDVKETLNIADMAPTILYWLGLPIPKYMEGNIPQNWFDNSSGEPRYIDIKGYESIESSLSEKEQAEIKERLKMLGYM